MKTRLLISLFFISLTLSPAMSEETLGGIKWLSYSELDRRSKSFIKLDEEESIKKVVASRVRLKEATPLTETDALLVYDANNYACGSGGCALTILLESGDGTLQEVFSVVCGSGVDERGHVNAGISLGRGYTNGMRNLRFENAVTWIWDKRTYQVK